MSVPFYNFKDLHHQGFRDKVKKRLSDIIDNSAFVEGEYNTKFENEFAHMQQAKHCLLVANGTDALEIALKVYGVKPGDHVGVAGITFYASAEAVINIGATPVWVDINPKNGLLCPNSLDRVHKKFKLKAVMPVHIYGLPAPMNEINQYCYEHGIHIVEDAAQAQGAYYSNGKPIGSFDNLTTFSFYPTKNLSAFGDAGCILTQDDDLAQKIIIERNHGRGNEQAMGRNSRCDHMQAAVLHLKLEEVERNNDMRKQVASLYHKHLEGIPVQLMAQDYIKLSSWHLYPIQLTSSDERQKLSAYLKEHNIGHTPFYERSMAQEPALSQYQGESEHADQFAGRTLCLPVNPFLKEEDVEYVANAVRKFFS
jgi:dTDP-4-amino-4,6-dideoxygalactose transaminase